MTDIALLILVIVTGLAASRAVQHHFQHTTAPRAHRRPGSADRARGRPSF
jgi:hypothetical protein